MSGSSPLPSVRPITPAATIFLPKEHGSWSLALEPLALGLLAAPSYAGAALATAAFAGFLARRPFKAVLQPDSATRGRPAARVLTLALLATCAAAGLAEAGLTGGYTALWPVLGAIPFAGLFVYFDSRGDARAAAAELAGCTAFAFLPATIATLAGWPAPAAFALAALALARSLPTVLTVRTYLRLAKQSPQTGRVAPMLAAILALGGVALLASRQLVPGPAVGLAVVLLLRTVWIVSPLRPGLRAKHLGIIEAILGVLYTALLAVAYHLR